MGTNFNIEAAKTCEKREARDIFKNVNKVNTRFRVILAGDHVLHTHIQYTYMLCCGVAGCILKASLRLV